MTEKRFNKVKVYLSYEIFDNKSNEQLDVNKTVDLMNQLNDENKKLKQNCKNYKWYKQYKAVLNENEQLKKELSEYKDFVLSDDKILCYTCLFCTHKGIYEVDCDVKGHVDVHGTCHSYTKKEVKE